MLARSAKHSENPTKITTKAEKEKNTEIYHLIWNEPARVLRKWRNQRRRSTQGATVSRISVTGESSARDSKFRWTETRDERNVMNRCLVSPLIELIYCDTVESLKRGN